MSAPVESPCNSVCTLDAAGRTCLGCMRSIDEIVRWAQLSEDERAAVVAALPQRARALEARGWSRLICGACGAEFSCGAGDKTAPCWCVRYPPVTPSGNKCLCPACLAEAASQEPHG